jgi:hypothetical protein
MAIVFEPIVTAGTALAAASLLGGIAASTVATLWKVGRWVAEIQITRIQDLANISNEIRDAVMAQKDSEQRRHDENIAKFDNLRTDISQINIRLARMGNGGHRHAS